MIIMNMSIFERSLPVMLTIIPIIVVCTFVLVFVFIIVVAIRGGSEWSKNNNSPVLTVQARVVAKRTAFGRYPYNNSDIHYNYSSYTTYYTTFEVESGDRMELRMPGNEYGLLVEGDEGKLTFQGNRFKGFERNK